MIIQELMDKAKQNNGFKSDRQLSKAIGCGEPTLLRIRRGWGYPSEDNMMKLGELAGIDRASALLLLNMWKAEGEAKNTYMDILRRVSATALCFIIMVTASPSFAHNIPLKMFHYVNDTVYYGKRKKFLRIGV